MLFDLVEKIDYPSFAGSGGAALPRLPVNGASCLGSRPPGHLRVFNRIVDAANVARMSDL
jgi:hypothetical protein